MQLRLSLILSAITLIASSAAAVEPMKIQDNSFLIEEAYNQERGVVQFISVFTRQRDGAWDFSFTNEWPLGGQTHQISYTLPYHRDAATGDSGPGDVLLNYRYQLIGNGEQRIAFSPRLSLIAPTSDEGTSGVEVNLPFSVALSDTVVTHWNAGRREYLDSESFASTFAGGSVIWAAHPKIHLMLETLMTRGESSSVVVSPGIRWAHDFDSGLQVVPGIALPIEVDGGESRAVLFYLSLEK